MSPIFVAIDTQDVHRAVAIARDVSGVAAGVKLGLEFFYANGEEGVLRIAEHGTRVFLDLKLHDIPNTVEKAVRALAHLQPAILTVHAAGGRAMMEAAKAAAPQGTKVVGVTVLTSLDQDDLASVGVRGRQSAIGNVLKLLFLICTPSQPFCTGLVRTPIPSISTSKISPGCMKTGGLRAAPTPPGVPVMITSPRSRLIATLIISISAGTLKMSWSVRASCITRPFKRPWMRNPRAPGGTASGVTSHGPNDPVASKFLPIVHCGVRS